MKRLRLAIFTPIVAMLFVPAMVFGHAVIYPKKSTTGAYEKYILRVPNEKDVATTQVEIRFPADLRVTAFADVAGWQLEVLTDSAKRIIGAVWTGSLPSKRFVEFPFVAANPKTAASLTWPVYQTYEGNERVEWTGAAGSKSPASVTNVALPDSSAVTATSGASSWIPWIAIALSLVALGLSLRRPSQRNISSQPVA